MRETTFILYQFKKKKAHRKKIRIQLEGTRVSYFSERYMTHTHSVYLRVVCQRSQV